MEDFLAYLAQFGELTSVHRGLVAQKTTRLHLRKGDYFQRSRAAVQRVGFVVEGVFRVCYLTATGEEVTHYFVEEQNMLICLTGLEHPPQSAPDSIVAHYVQAITDCQVLVITAADLQVLSQTIPGWDAITHKAIEQALSQKMRRIIPMLGQNGTTRYTSFLRSFPCLANRVPLAYLASLTWA
ncbi:cyclic nucleotide-binding domain-containing protein [Hymenobacter sp. ASUV-10]|uniref:Cyclic nucleotide-binding domain-containing protein n=1 Tax=Hymenobacter aranciens TaxID=3063996 RepID=A0ABT9BHA6_9BACT|nr:cyclic nucleotide-binding domain-containing protein [Hymenobacter sp. ASUV-10]MDO7876041.1 cyclic nucleotide-binding domain-containing protein [Hymenobacter sp. ASUV-10]